MNAEPDNTITIPSGAIGFPSANELTMITAMHGVDSTGACVSNLCTNGAPGADITWDTQTTGSQDSLVFFGASSDAANKLQALGSFMNGEPAYTVNVPTSNTLSFISLDSY